MERLADAALRSGRNPADVLLVAVSKTHGPEQIAEAYAAGLRHFGENRVEEAGEKICAVRLLLPPDLTWHMVGHIQSRKSADVPPLFDWVHSVDRFKIARRLSVAAVEAGKTLDVLFEVNVSGEASKEGYDLSGWPEDQAGVSLFLDDVSAALALPGIRCQGLMAMAPYTDDPELVRPVFRRTRAVLDDLRDRFSGQPWAHLSMGMSGDFEAAVEEGATLVRIGTALFGPREG
jgi:hypothetical protein